MAFIVHTPFEKNNTIIKDSKINTGRNPVSELFYGGENKCFSRFLFKFDEKKIKDLVNDKTFADISKLKHTLKIKNTSSFDESLIGTTTCKGQERACSFDLILFKINQEWDEGVGYDFESFPFIGGLTSLSECPSNWFNATGLSAWTETGVFSGSSSGITIATQHFDKGNEDINIDITTFVNDILTGDTNNGFGIAYHSVFEETKTDNLKFVGFFTRHTQTFFEPFVETTYGEAIKDDRSSFFLDKSNRLYLYVNTNGIPTNLDEIPTVTIYDNNDVIFSSVTGTSIVQATKGVYYVELTVPTTDDYVDCIGFRDVWGNIKINGISRPDIELDFILKDSNLYYNIGNNDMLPKDFGFSLNGVKRDEKIKRGDIKKILVSARIPFTIEQKQLLDKLQYRLFVKEGNGQFTVIDWTDINMTFNNNYFLLDTSWMIPNRYFIDLKVESNLEIILYNEIIGFDIINDANIK